MPLNAGRALQQRFNAVDTCPVRRLAADVEHPVPIPHPSTLAEHGPRGYFESALPILLRQDIGTAWAGRIAFSLSGSGGGAWTVDLNRRAVARGCQAERELLVEMPAAI